MKVILLLCISFSTVDATHIDLTIQKIKTKISVPLWVASSGASIAQAVLKKDQNIVL